ERQTFRDFEVIVVDNSGEGLARGSTARVIENPRNLGFGAAVNQGLRASRAPYLATLNDDAAARPGWLEALVGAVEPRPEAGMCASKVLLAGRGVLDSAGMLMCADGSSKQRGHGRPPSEFSTAEEVLLPSGSAALYRRAMLEETGGFDEDFFLYSEDTDLGLRARWAGWRCLYAPDAVVDHRYSHSAGRASPLKAYFVERNRLFLVVKNFPAPDLLKAPWFTLARYWWHLSSMRAGSGAAAEFRAGGGSAWKLIYIVLRAHLALAASLGSLWRKRLRIRRAAKIDPAAFRQLLRQHSLSPREVAAL
ncbi:MAG TPA: glycosyltransferase family 2 protein, partial [Bryobacteraceae bacterium]|nr:glycosyltransferase family 2 protein [Bryobacteraceae bacterium]